jgi:hypothetical protein
LIHNDAGSLCAEMNRVESFVPTCSITYHSHRVYDFL